VIGRCDVARGWGVWAGAVALWALAGCGDDGSAEPADAGGRSDATDPQDVTPTEDVEDGAETPGSVDAELQGDGAVVDRDGDEVPDADAASDDADADEGDSVDGADTDEAVDAAEDAPEGADTPEVTDAEEDLLQRRGCRRFGRPVRVGALPPPVVELSGMVQSRAHAGVLWMHNDSGHAAEVFAVDREGELLGRVAVNRTATDWEDLALGACGEQTCLYVGDIGDNLSRRARVLVHRFEEPDPTQERVDAVETMRLVYPDGARDAEGMVVTGDGEVWIFSKELGRMGVYRASFVASDEDVELEKVGEVEVRSVRGAATELVTGADWHPETGQLLVRTYTTVIRLEAEELERPETFLASEPEWLPAGRELQGEAIAWDLDGRGYLHASEGRGTDIFSVRCEE
jgi:hypothetical protein